MPLQNPFITYIDRSYNQIKQAVLNVLGVLVPEITDHNESNIAIRLLSVWSSIAEMLGYYIDNMARETFLKRTRLFKSAVKIAEQYDYRIASSFPATVELVFTIQNNGAGLFPGFSIPAGTEVSDGVYSFFTTQTVNIPASSLNTITVNIPATNASSVVGLFLGNSNGAANQEFELPENVSGFSVVALVSAVGWANVETLAYSIPSSQHFQQSVNESRRVIVRFGDGVNGQIPPAAAPITVNYERCDGTAANVPANTLTEILSALVPPVGFSISVTNPSRASAGTGVESLESLKKHIPYLVRTQNRAVSDQDYIDIGNLHPQVEQTSVFFQCGKTVDIYIVPVGGGIASGILVTAVQTWYQSRRLVTTRIRVFPAGEIRIQLAFILRVLPNYVRATVESQVIANLLAFFSPSNSQITIGGKLHISDIYQVIENTTGVSSSTITAIIPVPYGRPGAANTTTVLNWTRAIQPATATTNYWTLTFTAATVYQLFKDGNFVGNFSTGVEVVQPEIIFTISGSYVGGDQFEFYTYPYTSTDLDLLEQSIPTALASDFSITTIGGI